MARTFGEMGIREIQTGLAAKEFSAAEVTRGTFERIGEADGAVHAFLEPTEELALDAAARIDAAVAEVIAENPAEAEAYKGGKTKLISFFVGQVMRKMKGKANPALVNEALGRLLK